MKKVVAFVGLLGIIAIQASASAGTKTFIGKVISVVDGDTIKVLRDNKSTVKIRLHGVDSPEMEQPFGKKAKQYTSRLVLGKYVKVTVITQDPKGIAEGRVYYLIPTHRRPTDLSKQRRYIPKWRSLQYALVHAGHAWWYKKFAAQSAMLAKLEAEAKKSKRGLWADKDPTPPWEWRIQNGPSPCCVGSVRVPASQAHKFRLKGLIAKVPRGSYRLATPQQPNRPRNKNRYCKKDSDCVVAWRPCGYRNPICKDTWKDAINRTADQKSQSRWANRKPVCNRQLLCKNPKGRWLGSRAKCSKGLCCID